MTQDIIPTTDSNDSTLALVKAVKEACITNHGFNPQGIYCQITGKRIGFMHGPDFADFISSLSGDSEEIADDVAMRVCASMRPSIRWNKLRVESVAAIAKTNPMEVMAYVVNRVFHPNHLPELSAQLDAMARRIKTYAFIESVGMTAEMQEAMHWCLRVDAVIPANMRFGLTGIGFDSMEVFCATVIQACESALEKHERESKNSWSTGNPLTASTYYNSFNRRRESTPTAKARKAKHKSESFLDNALESLLGEKPASVAKPNVKPRPVTLASSKMPTKFGVKS